MNMIDDAPQFITKKAWRYYTQGHKAHTEGQSKDAATCVFQTADRAWWLAGWHDSQMEKECIE